jgi:hypothetical protein
MAKLEETDQIESIGTDLQTIKIKDKISALYDEMERLKKSKLRCWQRQINRCH